MTRRKTWQVRRAKYLRMAALDHNRKKRTLKHYRHPDRDIYQHTGKWCKTPTGVLQKEPVYTPKHMWRHPRHYLPTEDMEMLNTPSRGHPPRAQATYRNAGFKPSKSHPRFASNQYYYRPVKVFGRKKGRLRGSTFWEARACVFYRWQKAWPWWDPQQRTPVAPRTDGR